MSPRLRPLLWSTLIYRGGTMAFPLLAAYLLARDVPASEVGVVVGAFGVGALIADLAVAPMLARHPPLRVWLFGLSLHAAVLSVYPWLDGFVVLVIATTLWGLAFEVFTPVAALVLTRSTSVEQRRLSFALYRLAINVGMAVGPAAGAVLFAHAPRALFAINAASTVLAATVLATAWRRYASLGPDETVPDLPSADPDPAGQPRNLQLATIFALALPVHFAFALPPAFLAAYVVDGLQLASSWAGALFAANAALIIVFEVPFTAALRRFPLWHSLLLGYGLASVGLACMGMAGRSLTMLFVATVLWTFAEIILFPALLSYVSELPGRQPGRTLSRYHLGPSIGTIVVPVLSLNAIDGAPEAPWLVASGAVLLAGLALTAVRSSERAWHEPA